MKVLQRVLDICMVAFLFVSALLPQHDMRATADSPDRIAGYSIQRSSVERTNTGFCYPTGKSPTAPNGKQDYAYYGEACTYYEYAGWLARGDKDEDGDGRWDYASDYYHIGQDIEAEPEDEVYAIADGVVIYKSDPGYDHGWDKNRGDNNLGVIVKHRLRDGAEFLALYGHVHSNVSLNDSIEGGAPFATIGPFGNEPHLHFGIHPGSKLPQSDSPKKIGWGMMGLVHWILGEEPNTNGFADPIDWITAKSPYGQFSADDARVADPVWPVIALPGEKLQVTIALRNEGTATWQNEAGYTLVNAKNPMGAPERLPLPHEVPPAETATWILNLTAPQTPGLHQSRWQLQHRDEPVGERITVWVSVLPEKAGEWKMELNRLIEETKQRWEEAKQRGEEGFERFVQELLAQIQRELARIIQEQSQALLEAFLRQLEETCTGALMPAGALVLVGMWLGRRRKS